MGWLDKGFSLPSLSGLTSSITSTVGSSVGFSVGNAAQRVSEAARSTVGTFGDGGPFSKLGANMPSFDQLKASAMRAGSILAGGTGALVNQQIQAEAAKAFPQATASQLNAATGATKVTSGHFVSLTEVSDAGNKVQFNVMPEIVEARTVEYEPVQPAQFPGSFQKYKGTSATQWTLNCTFIARNVEEATDNLEQLNMLRGWTMPFYGDITGEFYPGKLGAPPPVLQLYGLRNLVGTVPVVITSLNWNWPKDVDYLPTSRIGEDGKQIPFPAVMNIAIQLVESFSTGEFNRFSLKDYREGRMTQAYGRPVAQQELSTDSGVEVGSPRDISEEQPPK